MTRFIEKKTNWNKVVTLALTGATLMSPILSGSARADSDNNSRHNRGNSQTDNYDARDLDVDGDVDQNDANIARDRGDDFNNYNGDNDRRIDVANNNKFVTYNGVVTRELNGNNFEFRADNGQTYTVELQNDETDNVRRGFRVRVTGRLRNNENTLRRATVSVLDNGNSNVGTTTRTGVVTRDMQGDRFEFRADNGENFIVNIQGNGGIYIPTGRRVRVTGLRNGNRITRATVQLLDNGGNVGQRVTLRGVVTRDWQGRRFQMRSQNTLYNVSLTRGEPSRLSVGDRVEVSGQLNKGNSFVADTLRIIRDNDWGNSSVGISVDEVVTVYSVQSSRLFKVRYSDGKFYDVRSNYNIDNRISTGDLVRVVGTLASNRVVNASRVELRSDNGNSGGISNGERVDLRGTIRNVNRQLFGGAVLVIDGDGGRTFSVRVGNAGNWRAGDRVRVRGTISNNVITNAQVDRI